jgi:hypothetical protein
MYQKVICIFTIVFFINIPAVFSAGGKVTVHNAKFIYSLKYKSKNKEHTINFDPQNEGGQYRLRGKRNFQILEVYVNENGKEKNCKCNDDATFRWRTRHPVNISYKSEYDGFDGMTIDISGTIDGKFKEIKCACE